MSTLCGVSARTFLVFMGVLALVGLLGFGLVAKGEGSLSVGDPVPTTELAALEGERPARWPITAASGCS